MLALKLQAFDSLHYRVADATAVLWDFYKETWEMVVLTSHSCFPGESLKKVHNILLVLVHLLFHLISMKDDYFEMTHLVCDIWQLLTCPFKPLYVIPKKLTIFGWVIILIFFN